MNQKEQNFQIININFRCALAIQIIFSWVSFRPLMKSLPPSSCLSLASPNVFLNPLLLFISLVCSVKYVNTKSPAGWLQHSAQVSRGVPPHHQPFLSTVCVALQKKLYCARKSILSGFRFKLQLLFP